MLTWIDLETTGLDPANGSILEIAIVTTDDDLNEIGEPFVSLVAPIYGFGIEAMDGYVREMHTRNQLIADLYAETSEFFGESKVRPFIPNLRAVEEKAIDELLMCGGDRDAYRKTLKKTPLAGSSVHFDRAWLAVHMPELERLFSHRHVDVSSFTEMAKRWAPKTYAKRPGLDAEGKPLPAHRALDDIRQSIATLKFYREAGLWGGAK